MQKSDGRGNAEGRLSDGHVSVMSRGLMVFGESPANELAVEVMKEKDIDISHHVAKPLTRMRSTEMPWC